MLKTVNSGLVYANFSPLTLDLFCNLKKSSNEMKCKVQQIEGKPGDLFEFQYTVG